MNSSEKPGLQPVKQTDRASFRNQPMENHLDTDLDEHLNETLAQMAHDVPSMPDSFREGWRQAIRQDQKDNPCMDLSRQSTERSAIQQDYGLFSAKSIGSALSAKAEQNRKTHLRRLISVAALAVFLLGGAMLARPSLFVFMKSSPALQEANAKVQEFNAVSETGPVSEEEMITIEETDSDVDAVPLPTGSVLYSSWFSEGIDSGSATAFGAGAATEAAAFSAVPSSVPDPEKNNSISNNLIADNHKKSDTENTYDKILANSVTEISDKTDNILPIRIAGLVLIVLSLSASAFLLFRKKHH